jgi:L-ascorbate oxidase
MRLSVLAAFLGLAAAPVIAINIRVGYGGPQVHDSSFVPDEVLRISEENVFIGCESRVSVLVNGTSPGPALRLQPGKTTWIRVYNDMDHWNTTMHWHGLTMRTAPFADGSSVSQWPIPPKHYFDYEIHPAKDEQGTYFYHSHIGFQASTCGGPLIIEDRGAPPYAYDEERIIFFSDHYSETDEVIEAGLTNKTAFKWTGETKAVLLNGVGVAINATAGIGSCRLPIIDVEPDKTYRFRFIGGTALSLVQFGITDHPNFTIIEADGSYTKPLPVEYIQASPGQRFDALLTTKTTAELNGQTDFIFQIETKDRPAVYHGYGILRYSGGEPQVTTAPASPPLTLSNETYAWAEYALEPLYPNNFPDASEVTRRITIDSRQLRDGTIVWHLNDLMWNETSNPLPGDKPYLVNIYENGPSAIPNYDVALENEGWDPESLTWPFKLGEVVEIIWQNTGSLVDDNGGIDFHPFHAHGGHYYDIGSGNGTYNWTDNEERLKGYNPVMRDTTNLYRYGVKTNAGIDAGWRGWRLRVEYAGVWMVHCHILQHMIMGMQAVWVMGDYEQITAIPLDDAEGYMTWGGNVNGNDTYDPTVVHFFGDDADW